VREAYNNMRKALGAGANVGRTDPVPLRREASQAAVGASTASLRGSASHASERTGETSASGLSSSQDCA
jgi:hypothetical protein